MINKNFYLFTDDKCLLALLCIKICGAFGNIYFCIKKEIQPNILSALLSSHYHAYSLVVSH